MKQRLRFARLLQGDSGARNPKKRVTAPFSIRPNVALAMPKPEEKSNNYKRRNSPASKIWQDNRSLCPREANSVDRHLMYQPCRLAPGDCFGPVIYFSKDRSKSAVRLTLRGEALRTNRTRPLNCERITIRRQLKMLVTKSEQIISTVESAFLALRLPRRAHHPLHRKAFSPHSFSH